MRLPATRPGGEGVGCRGFGKNRSPRLAVARELALGVIQDEITKAEPHAVSGPGLTASSVPREGSDSKKKQRKNQEQARAILSVSVGHARTPS